MSSERRIWLILSGEYPPQPGGVSDYTRLVADALTAAGDQVEVWAPCFSIPAGASEFDGKVHRLPDHFGLRGLVELNEALDRMPPSFRILVQYVPHAFGWKAMNIPFCLWLWTKRRRHQIDVMFHEVAFPFVAHGRILRHNFLALVNRLMALLVVRSASRIFMSILGWKGILRTLAGSGPKLEWLPVPSTMPTQVDAERVISLRMRLLRGSGNFLVGHFGTFGGHIAQELRLVVQRILIKYPAVTVLFVGRGGLHLADSLRREHSTIDASRLVATGSLEGSGGCRTSRFLRPTHSALPRWHQQSTNECHGGSGARPGHHHDQRLSERADLGGR